MSLAQNNGHDEGGDDILAAEYVVGVLPAEERQAVAARLERDAAFARLVDRWEQHFAPMAAGYPEVEVPAAVKAALDRRLFEGYAAKPRVSLWSSLAFWRGLSAAAVAALIVAVVMTVFIAPPSDQAAQRLVASLAPQESDVHYFVVYDASTQDVGLSHVTGARPDGRDFELWVIREGQPPVSVGVIPVGQSVHLAVAQAIKDQIDAGAVFAISLEPPGGSPTGQPTGPVVAAGDLHNV